MHITIEVPHCPVAFRNLTQFTLECPPSFTNTACITHSRTCLIAPSYDLFPSRWLPSMTNEQYLLKYHLVYLMVCVSFTTLSGSMSCFTRFCFLDAGFRWRQLPHASRCIFQIILLLSNLATNELHRHFSAPCRNMAV